jgi:hypothetical protein
VFDRLGRRNQTCIDGDAFAEILDRSPSSAMPFIAWQGSVCGRFAIISNTCSRRPIWPCVFSWCVMNACVSSGISAALAILGRVRKILFRAVNILQLRQNRSLSVFSTMGISF